MRNRIKQYLSKSKVLRSLKYRIFFIILLVGFIPAMILRYGILQNYEERAVSLRSSDVQTQIKILANNLITYNYLTKSFKDNLVKKTQRDNKRHINNHKLNSNKDEQ